MKRDNIDWWLGSVAFDWRLFDILEGLKVFAQSFEFLVSLRRSTPLSGRSATAMGNAQLGLLRRRLEKRATIAIRAMVDLTIVFGGGVDLGRHCCAVRFFNFDAGRERLVASLLRLTFGQLLEVILLTLLSANTILMSQSVQVVGVHVATGLITCLYTSYNFTHLASKSYFSPSMARMRLYRFFILALRSLGSKLLTSGLLEIEARYERLASADCSAVRCFCLLLTPARGRVE